MSDARHAQMLEDLAAVYHHYGHDEAARNHLDMADLARKRAGDIATVICPVCRDDYEVSENVRSAIRRGNISGSRFCPVCSRARQEART